MRGLESPIPVRRDRFVDGAPPRDLVLSESHDVQVADALPAQVLDERQQRRSRLPDGNPVGTKPNLVRLGHVGSIVSLRHPPRILTMGACLPTGAELVEQWKTRARSRVS
jgi:hypothetical protein